MEFMAAVLSNGKGFYHPIVYVLECHRLGLKLLPPSMNQPGPLFLPTGPANHEGPPARAVLPCVAITAPVAEARSKRCAITTDLATVRRPSIHAVRVRQ
jgi:hypothetical protein